MLELKNRTCLIVGGGVIALRKVTGLLRAQATIVVVSPEFEKRFRRFRNSIVMIQKTFESTDITNDCAVVIAATNSNAINRMVSQRARELNIPCNVVDQPDLCSFIVPAVIRRGAISVAISTNAASPRFSKYLKKKIGETVTNDYARIAGLMAEVRLLLKNNCPVQRKRFALWERIFEQDPVDEMQKNGFESYRMSILNSISEELTKGN
jgi:uroporphyrin-III C-methyltransferase/precorrin-2 dehydrogenase/sirohydrochlorin ferrochelatase